MPDDYVRYIMKNWEWQKDNAIPGALSQLLRTLLIFRLGEKDRCIIILSRPQTSLPCTKHNNHPSCDKTKDILLHPYHSYNQIINLLREASVDGC